MASLLSNGRQSRLDMPVGIDESRATQASEREAQNDVHRTRKIERAGRRAYRSSMRAGDGIGALQALEKMEMMGGRSASLKIAGQDRKSSDQLYEGRRAQTESANGKTMDANGKLVSRVQGNGGDSTSALSKAADFVIGKRDKDGRIEGDGAWNEAMAGARPSGVTDEMLQAEISRRDNTPQSSAHPTPPTSTPLSSRVGTSFAEQDAAARERSTASGAFGDKTFQVPADSRQRFAQDLSTSKLIEDGDQGALSRAVQRGAGLGLSREQVLGYAGINPAIEPSGPPAEGTSELERMIPMANGLRDASRILRNYRSSQNNELTQSRINPSGQSPVSGLASRLFGGGVSDGSGFNPEAPPSMTGTPASRLLGPSLAQPAVISVPSGPSFTTPQASAAGRVAEVDGYRKSKRDAYNKVWNEMSDPFPSLGPDSGLNKVSKSLKAYFSGHSY